MLRVRSKDDVAVYYVIDSSVRVPQHVASDYSLQLGVEFRIAHLIGNAVVAGRVEITYHVPTPILTLVLVSDYAQLHVGHGFCWRTT